MIRSINTILPIVRPFSSWRRGWFVRFGEWNLNHAWFGVKGSFVNLAFALRSLGNSPTLVSTDGTFNKTARHDPAIIPWGFKVFPCPSVRRR